MVSKSLYKNVENLMSSKTAIKLKKYAKKLVVYNVYMLPLYAMYNRDRLYDRILQSNLSFISLSVFREAMNYGEDKEE